MDCTTDADIRMAESIAPYVHGHINTDRNVAPRYTKDTSKYINMPCGYGRQWFYDANKPRDKELVLLGEIHGRADREQILANIVREDIPITTTDTLNLYVASDHATRSPIQQYVHILQTTKLTLNLTAHPTYPILNGKWWEGLACGTCLVNMDYPGSPMSEIFIPDVDYISITPENYIEKIKYYLKNLDEAEAIARSGSEKYWHKFPPERFWHTLCNI
jgi:hypothetical protein